MTTDTAEKTTVEEVLALVDQGIILTPGEARILAQSVRLRRRTMRVERLVWPGHEAEGA